MFGKRSNNPSLVWGSQSWLQPAFQPADGGLESPL
jgi:hypothetical protein